MAKRRVDVFMSGKFWFYIISVSLQDVILGFRDLISWKTMAEIQLCSCEVLKERLTLVAYASAV